MSDDNTAYIYIRLSKADREKGDSVEAQEKLNRDYADRTGLKVLDVLVDDGISGAVLDRDGIQSAISDAHDRKFKHLITKSHKRFARKMIVAGVLRNEFIKAGIKIHYVLTGGEIDHTTESGFTQDVIQDMISQLERMRIRRRTNEGRYRSAARGNVLTGASVLYGYEKVKTNPGTTESETKFKVIEEEAIIVRRIFDEFNNGSTQQKIVDGLNNDGVRRHEPGPWQHWNVRMTLDATDYIGHRYYGTRKRTADGRRLNVPIDDPGVQEIDVPAIVDQDVWDKARVRRASMNRKAAGRAKHTYLLKGRISCAECGSNYKSQTRSDKDRASRYNHNWDYRDCPNKSVHFRADYLEPIIKDQIIEIYIMNPPDWNRLHEEGPTGETEKEIRKLKRRYEALDKKQSSFEDMRADGEMSKERYQERLAELDTDRDRLSAKIDKLSDDKTITYPSFIPTEREYFEHEIKEMKRLRGDYFGDDEWFHIIDHFDIGIKILDSTRIRMTGTIGEIPVDLGTPKKSPT